jgi:hypothetical protein
MRTLYKKFKEITGIRGADLAEVNNFTRQYISLIANNPNKMNVIRLATMMKDAIRHEIEKEEEAHELKMRSLRQLRNEIDVKLLMEDEVSA